MPPPGDPARFSALFRPPQTEFASLSPDGRHLAYTLREGETLSVIVVDLDQPGVARARLSVAEDRTSTPRFTNAEERTPARINWMKWVTPERLVLETNTQVAISATASLPGVVSTFLADGSGARILATPRDVRELLTSGSVDVVTRDRRPLGPTVDDPAFSNGGTAAALEAARELAAADGLLPSGGLFEPGSLLDVTGAAPTDVIDPIAGTTASLSPLTPKVFDLDPAHPGAVLLRTTGRNGLTTHRLFTDTGRLQTVANHVIDPERLTLLDRQGVPRLSAPATTIVRFPHRVELDRGPGSRRARDLATAAGLSSTPGAFTVSPDNFFGERVVPLGFDEDPAILFYASNVGRDTYGIYSVNLATGQRTDVAIEHPTLDLIDRPEDSFGPSDTLIHDRHTRRLVGLRLTHTLRTARWLDADLQAVQGLIERSLPGRSIEILEWDEGRRRFLAAVGGPSDPGGFVVFDRTNNRLAEYTRRAPWLDVRPRHRTVSLVVEAAAGVDVPCQLTLPAAPRLQPVPLVVVCPPAPWARVPAVYQAEIQALADMGFAVVQPAAAGSWGYGVRRREAIHGGYEMLEIERLSRVVEELARSFKIDPKRVGLVGSGYGAYVALRAMQVRPEAFRCAVALEPPLNLSQWLADGRASLLPVGPQLVRNYYGPPGTLNRRTLAADAERIVRPLLVLSFPGPDGSWRRDTFLAARNFARAVRRPGVEVEFQELSEEFAAGLPAARAAVYREIEFFLNNRLYDFTVKLGDPVETR